MKRKNKKGFTIVELVIVIAVIAILAAVLIPVFSNVVRKANESKDIQLVRNLNEALAVDLDEHNTMYDALQAAKEFGYDVDKINASATDNEILWDSVNDCFVYLQNGTPKYIPEVNDPKATENWDLWMIVDEIPDTQTYSLYAGNGFNDTQVEVSVGFDVGENTGIEITVNSDEKASEEHPLVYRAATKADLVTITAPEAKTVNFYGEAGELELINVPYQSLHIFGQVEFLSVNTGRVVVEKDSAVKGIHIESTSAVVVVETQATVETITKEAGITLSGSNLEATGFNHETLPVVDKEEAKASAKLFAGGNGTADLPFIIETADQWNNIYKADKKYYYVLNNDIDFDGVTIESIDEYLSVVIDGQNHSLLNVSDVASGYLFSGLDDSTIKNINLEYDIESAKYAVATAYRTKGDCFFENVNVRGSLRTTGNWACAFVAYPNGNVTYKNCVNYADCSASCAKESYVAAFGSHCGYAGAIIKFVDCSNYGNMNGQNVAGFAGMGNPDKFVLEGENNNFGAFTYVKKAKELFLSDTSKETNVVATKVPTVQTKLPDNLGEYISFDAIEGAKTYDVTISFTVQYYGYPGVGDKWGGGFTRTITHTFEANEGVVVTDFVKGIIYEKQQEKYYSYGVDGEEVVYNGGLFKDVTGATVIWEETISSNSILKLLELNDEIFYYLETGSDNVLIPDGKTQIGVNVGIDAKNEDKTVAVSNSTYYFNIPTIEE